MMLNFTHDFIQNFSPFSWNDYKISVFVTGCVTDMARMDHRGEQMPEWCSGMGDSLRISLPHVGIESKLFQFLKLAS